MDDISSYFHGLQGAVAPLVREGRIRRGCPGYHFFGDDVPAIGGTLPKSTVNGVELPRNDHTLYRGVPADSPQFGSPEVVRAILGDPTAYIPGKYFSEVKAVLQRQKDLDQSSLVNEFQSDGVYGPIQTLLACEPHGFSNQEASLYAADISARAMWSYQRRGWLESTYLNEGGPHYQDYPVNAFYSSPYQAVAGFYGGKILLYHEARPRSVDRLYWQNVRNGVDMTNHFPVDNGEFLTPGYVPPEDVSGIWYKLSDPAPGAPPSSNTIGIDLAIQKVRVNGQNYAVILDGAGRYCLDESPQHEFFYCRRNYPNPDQTDVKPFPILETDKPVPIVAVVKLCETKKDCKYPDEVFARFSRTSDRDIPSWLVDEIQSAQAEFSRPVALFRPGKKNPIVHGTESRMERTVTLHAAVSGDCLDVPYGSSDDRARIIQWTCSGAANQQFKLIPKSDGYFMIMNVNSGKCLDIPYATTDASTPLEQAACNGGDNQQFGFQSGPSGGHFIVVKHSQQCLDIANDSGQDQYAGTNVVQFPCHGEQNQIFSTQ